MVTEIEEKKKPRKYTKSSIKIHKCVYKDCDLFYARPVGLKKHLLNFDHGAFGISEISEENETNFRHLNSAPLKPKKSASNLKNEEAVKSEVLCIKKLYSRSDDLGLLIKTTFPNGVLKIKSGEKQFFCRIPGCGKNFKSGLAYKYHCSTYQHDFIHVMDEFERKQKKKLDYKNIENLITEFSGLKKDFEISGITHHTSETPDGDYNVKFSIASSIKKRKKNSVSGEVLIPQEVDSDDVKTEYSGVIERIILSGQEYELNSVLDFELNKILNVNKNISCAVPVKNSNYFCMCLRKDAKPTELFEFSDSHCEIQIFKDDLTVFHKMEFECGYVRKMSVVFEEDVFCFVVLFNNGKLRKFRFKEKIFDDSWFEIENVIDFSISSKKNVILVTNGANIYKIVDDQISLVSTKFDFPIVSVVVRDLDEGDVEFFYLDTNGKLLRCNSEFRATEEIYSLTGITSISLIEKFDALLVVDSFSHITRYIKMTDVKGTHVLFKNAITTIACLDGKIIGGSFEGKVNLINMKRKKIKEIPIFRIVRRKNSFFLSFKQNECMFWDSKAKNGFDPSIVIIGLFVVGGNVVICCANGIVVSVPK